MKKFKSIRHLVALGVVLALMLSASAVVYAETGTVTVTGGTLAVTPANITNLTGVTLDGTDQTSTSASGGNSWAAEDPTGTGNGWNLTITSTDFGINEVQQVYTDAASGNLTLTYSGETTGSILYNADASAVETALEALTNITDVTVTGEGTSGTPWVVTFVDPGKQNIAEMTGTDVDLSAEAVITISTTTQGRTINISAADQEFKIQLLDANITVTSGNTKPTSSVTSLTVIPETGSTLKFLSAAVDTGMGDYAINPNFELEVISETYAGTYTATFTVAIVSAP